MLSKLSRVTWRGLYLGAGGWGTPSQTVFTQGTTASFTSPLQTTLQNLGSLPLVVWGSPLFSSPWSPGP